MGTIKEINEHQVELWGIKKEPSLKAPSHKDRREMCCLENDKFEEPLRK